MINQKKKGRKVWCVFELSFDGARNPLRVERGEQKCRRQSEQVEMQRCPNTVAAVVWSSTAAGARANRTHIYVTFFCTLPFSSVLGFNLYQIDNS